MSDYDRWKTMPPGWREDDSPEWEPVADHVLKKWTDDYYSDVSDPFVRLFEYANAEDQAPKCDKCGATITTGAMGIFCPLYRECEFYTPELDEFISGG